jgi:hypothetical protein
MIAGPATRPGTVQGALPRTPSAPRSAPDSPADVAWCAMNEDDAVPRRLLVDAPATRASARTVAIIDEALRVTGRFWICSRQASTGEPVRVMSKGLLDEKGAGSPYNVDPSIE